MADASVVHIGENSPEEIAYKLFRHVIAVEGKDLFSERGAERGYILQTYADCLTAVKDPYNRAKRAT